MTCLAHFLGEGAADSVAAAAGAVEEEYEETGCDTSEEFWEVADIPSEGFLTALDVFKRR